MSKVYVGQRRGLMEVTLLLEDGAYQAVCDCGTVHVFKVGKTLTSRCRDCNTKIQKDLHKPHTKTGIVQREYVLQEEAMIEHFNRGYRT